MPNPGLRLKEPAIAGYAYNPPQTPPFEKEGLVVSLRLTSPQVRTIQIAILRYGHCLVVGEEILRCAQDDNIRGIARDI